MQHPVVRYALFFGGLLLFLALAGLRPPLENGVALFDKIFLVLLAVFAFCCMMLGLLAGSAGKRLFASRPLRHIALVSYGMYLLHVFIMTDIFRLGGALTVGVHNHFVIYFTGFALFFAVTVFLATILYYALEKPFIEWAKKEPAEK